MLYHRPVNSNDTSKLTDCIFKLLVQVPSAVNLSCPKGTSVNLIWTAFPIPVNVDVTFLFCFSSSDATTV